MLDQRPPDTRHKDIALEEVTIDVRQCLAHTQKQAQSTALVREEDRLSDINPDRCQVVCTITGSPVRRNDLNSRFGDTADRADIDIDIMRQVVEDLANGRRIG